MVQGWPPASNVGVLPELDHPGGDDEVPAELLEVDLHCVEAAAAPSAVTITRVGTWSPPGPLDSGSNIGSWGANLQSYLPCAERFWILWDFVSSDIKFLGT